MTRFLVKIDVDETLQSMAAISALLDLEEADPTALTLRATPDGGIQLLHVGSGTVLGRIPAAHPMHRSQRYEVVAYDVVGNSQTPIRVYISVTISAELTRSTE